MDISGLIIEEGNNFTARQLKTRLSLMGLNISDESIPKSELVKIYDEAIKKKENMMKILNELIHDTDSKKKNIKEEILRRRDPIEIEVSREPKLSSNPSICNIRLTGRSNLENKFNDLIPSDNPQSNFNQNFQKGLAQEKNQQLQRRISIQEDSNAFSNKDLKEKSNLLTSENKIFDKKSNEFSGNLNQDHLSGLKTNANTNIFSQAKENLISQQYNVPDYIYLNKEKFNKFNNSDKYSIKENNSSFELSNKNILNNLPPNFYEGEINKLDPLLQKDKRRSEIQKIPNFQDIINVQFNKDNNKNNFIPQIMNKGETLNNACSNEIKIYTNKKLINQDIYSVHHFGDSIFSQRQNKFNKPFRENKDDFIENKYIQAYQVQTINETPINFRLADCNNLQKNNNILQTIKEVDSEANSKSIDKKIKKSNLESGDIINTNITNIQENYNEKEFNSNCNFNSANAKLKDYDSINNRLPRLNNAFNSDLNSMDSLNSQNNFIPNYSLVFKTNNEYPIPENNLTGGKNKFIKGDKESSTILNYPSFNNFNKQASKNISPHHYKESEKGKIYISGNSNKDSIEDSNKLKVINNDKNVIQISNGNNKSEKSKIVPTYSSETYQPLLENQGKNKIFVNEKSENENQKPTNFRNIPKQTEDYNNLRNLKTNLQVENRDTIMQINSNEKQENLLKSKIISEDDDNYSFVPSEKQTYYDYIFKDHQKIIFAIVGLGFIVVSLAGLNNAQVINLRNYVTKSFNFINEMTVGNFIKFFDKLIKKILKLILNIFEDIISMARTSIWNNIYMIVFLIIIVLIIRYIYLKIHYRKISQEIFKIIKNKLREIKRNNSNDYRAGIRVEEIVNEFSQMYQLDQNNFRENILPYLRILRNKDEDIRCFGENEGGKYFEKWQFKGF